MKVPVDQTFDISNFGVFTLLRGVPVPDYVKEAELPDREEIVKNASEAFADTRHKWYPINSPANAYVSNVFFTEKKAELKAKFGQSYIDEVQTNIGDAANLFGITADLDSYQQFLNSRVEKQAQEAQPVVAFEADGLPVEMWVVKNAEEFSAAASAFTNSIKKFPFTWRSKIACDFMTKAPTYGVNELPDLLCKYAMIFYPDQPKVVRELARRREKMSSEENKERVNRMIADVPSFNDKLDYLKVAAEMHQMEQEEGLYDKEATAGLLPDIVDSLFTLPVSKIAEMLDTVEMAGERFSITDLQKVAADQYKAAFGLEIDPADKTALRDVLPTMPRSDVALFKELTGIKPSA
jgi:hypothetical protein